MLQKRTSKRHGLIPVELLNRPDMSLEAKGLFAFLQSKPDGYELSVEEIHKQTKEGRAVIQSVLQELIWAGYLHVEWARGEENWMLDEEEERNA